MSNPDFSSFVRTGIFGGTFDPPHNGHLALALFARELLSLDRLVISVSKNPFKVPTATPDADRLRMAELLVEEINLTGAIAEISSWELERPGPSFTIDLLRHFRALHSESELWLLVGEDSFHQMHRWHLIDAFSEFCRIAVFRRPWSEGDEIVAPPASLLESARFIDIDVPVSATSVRELLAGEGDLSSRLPASIHNYIEKKGLYR